MWAPGSVCTAVSSARDSETEWPVPDQNFRPLHLIRKGNLVYFTESLNKLAVLNLNTNQITEWLLPSGGFANGIAMVGTSIFLATRSPDTITMVEPATNTVTELRWRAGLRRAGLPTA